MECDSKLVGQVICRLRKERGKTQEVLSGLCGIARSHLSMIEAGRKSLKFETLWKIAVALDISPSVMVRLIEEEHLSQHGDGHSEESDARDKTV